MPHTDSYEEMAVLAHEAVLRRGLAAEGDRVIVTAGVPFDTAGKTNLMKVETI